MNLVDILQCEFIWYRIGSKRKTILEQGPNIFSQDGEKRATERCNVDILVNSKRTLTLCLEHLSTLREYDREMIRIAVVSIFFPNFEAINNLHDEAIVNDAKRCMSVDRSRKGERGAFDLI